MDAMLAISEQLRFPDNLGSLCGSVEKRKNPANTKVFTGFPSIGPAGFEPTTSTTPRLERSDEKPTKTKGKRGSTTSLTSTLTLGSENFADFATVDESVLRRLLMAFGAADESQRLAILTVAETLVGTKGA